MKAMKRFLSLAMVCLLLCGLLPGFAYADDPAVGAIALSNASGNAGDTVTVDVTIQSNPGVMALTLKPQFDTTVLELKETAVDTEAGWTLGADGQVLYDTYSEDRVRIPASGTDPHRKLRVLPVLPAEGGEASRRTQEHRLQCVLRL